MEFLNLFLLLVPIIGGLSIAIIAIVTDHKQKILMIQKGLNINSYCQPGLRSGLTFTFLGTALTLLMINMGNFFGVPWYAPGIILITLGMAQLLFYFLSKKDLQHIHRIAALERDKDISG